MPRRLGIPPYGYLRPVFKGVMDRQGSRSSRFTCIEGSPAQLMAQLRQHTLDGAFLSPIEYAREYGKYSIVPRVSVSSAGESGIVILRFGEHLRTISTLAVDPADVSEVVLAHLILVEKFGGAPTIVPVSDTGALRKASADAVLLTGDRAWMVREEKKKIDLVDEWYDLTGLPYVHGLWIVHRGTLDWEDVAGLAESAAEGERRYEALKDTLPPNLRFDLNDDVLAGLTEFFRMSYYHGILKDIPDLMFETEEQTDIDPGGY